MPRSFSLCCAVIRPSCCFRSKLLYSAASHFFVLDLAASCCLLLVQVHFDYIVLCCTLNLTCFVLFYSTDLFVFSTCFISFLLVLHMLGLLQLALLYKLSVCFVLHSFLMLFTAVHYSFLVIYCCLHCCISLCSFYFVAFWQDLLLFLGLVVFQISELVECALLCLA